MKYSLRIKLFITFSGLIFFYTLLSLLMNNLLLETYYFYNKKNSLGEICKAVDKLFEGDQQMLPFELEKLEHDKGLRIVILDKNYETVYSSFLSRRTDLKSKLTIRNNTPQIDKIPEDLIDMMPEALIRERAQRILNGETIIEKRHDDRLNSANIDLYSVLKNGDFIYISTPVAAIQESAKISNKFFLFTSILIIIAGSCMIFVISSKFARPILELNSIARGMAKLDFSRRYPVKTRDEIGQLGESINSLSEQLYKSILELKEANENLREDIEKERKIDEMRKEFISSVSHELKTPIALIQGYAEGLKVNVNEDEENKDFYCNVIIDEALKMNKLVKQLLELAQLESGKLRLERRNFNLTQLLKQVLKKNSLILKEKNIDVNINFENKQEIIVNADIDKTEQILMNYLSNAINHIDSKKILKISLKRCADKLRVSIFNSGKHIPEESLDKIWTSFYKVDKARTRAYGGTGLGLSIVQAIQEAHFNEYGVENVKDGVEFWFELDLFQHTEKQDAVREA